LKSEGTHLHIYFPSKPFTMDGYTFSDANIYQDIALYSTQGSQPAPSNTNLISNSTFDSASGWIDVGYGTSVSGGVLHVPATNGYFYTDSPYSLATGSPMEITFKLRNAGTTTRTLSAAINRTTDWTGSF